MVWVTVGVLVMVGVLVGGMISVGKSVGVSVRVWARPRPVAPRLTPKANAIRIPVRLAGKNQVFDFNSLSIVILETSG